MITEYQQDANPCLSNFIENQKLSFLTSLLTYQAYIFPLHLITVDAAGVPSCSCGGGSHCMGLGKHPRGRWSTPWDPGSKRTEALLALYHEKWPNRGFGIHLGLSGLCCLDIDPKNGGMESLEQLQRGGVIPDIIWHVRTGSGGLHAYFRSPVNVDPRRGWRGPNGQTRCSLLLAPGVEWHSGQHFMVLPFSPHKSGDTYTLLAPWAPGPVPELLAARINSRPTFEVRPGAAPSAPRARPQDGGAHLPPSIENARKYLATIEPAVSGKEGSRRTGRVAAILRNDFDLSRADTITLLLEWNKGCEPPWTLDQLNRKVDWAESRPGTRGWRNRLNDGGLTAEEAAFDKQLEGLPITIKGTRNESKLRFSLIDEKCDSPGEATASGLENGLVEPVGSADVEGVPSSQGAAIRLYCQHWRPVLFKVVGQSVFEKRLFPCRKMSCPACFIKKKGWYVDTVKQRTAQWVAGHGGDDCPPIYIAVVQRAHWKKLAARIRRVKAEFICLDILATGDIPGETLLVLATACPDGPTWSEVHPDDGANQIAEAVNNLPGGLRVRVWSSSHGWKLLREDQEPKKKLERINSHHSRLRNFRRIGEWRGSDVSLTAGGGSRWGWHGERFPYEPEQHESILADLLADDILQAGTKVVSSRRSAIPDKEGDFVAELLAG